MMRDGGHRSPTKEQGAGREKEVVAFEYSCYKIYYRRVSFPQVKRTVSKAGKRSSYVTSQ